jgi:hypothetical protein
MIYGLASPVPWVQRPLYLLWTGSIVGSLLVLLPGMAIGSHSHALCASTLLNVPYVLIPVLFCKKVRQKQNFYV